MNIDISNINLVLIFAGVMAGVIVLYFLCFWQIRGQQINTIASIVTVIGVLGTFVGIAIGLYYFDTSNIEESVPKLLDGLKIAFATSILGISLSILLKFYALYESKKNPAPAGKTVEDLAGLLEEILAVEKEEGNKTRDTLHAIERSLTGREYKTVLTQLQELRTTVSDKQDALISSLTVQGNEARGTLRAIERSLTGEGDSTVLTQLQEVSGKQDALISSFDKFANKMAENNTNALIKALEGVMRDFNAKINEQFGDNFRQLNEAVGKLNEWQKQYHQQMEELAEEFRIAAESIETSRQSLEVITKRSNTISSAAEKLDPILKAVEEKIKELDTHLKAFSALADKAGTAFPIIEDQLNELTGRIFQKVEDRITAQFASLDKFSTENERTITAQLASLDTMLQEKLTKALESLGNQLFSLSKKFVDDYTPLTEKLSEVVKMANGIDTNREM